ncbi:hypothetical protein ABPG75_009182 [Micractinium tetrahymenae]
MLAINCRGRGERSMHAGWQRGMAGGARRAARCRIAQADRLLQHTRRSERRRRRLVPTAQLPPTVAAFCLPPSPPTRAPMLDARLPCPLPHTTTHFQLTVPFLCLTDAPSVSWQSSSGGSRSATRGTGAADPAARQRLEQAEAGGAREHEAQFVMLRRHRLGTCTEYLAGGVILAVFRTQLQRMPFAF